MQKRLDALRLLKRAVPRFRPNGRRSDPTDEDFERRRGDRLAFSVSSPGSGMKRSRSCGGSCGGGVDGMTGASKMRLIRQVDPTWRPRYPTETSRKPPEGEIAHEAGAPGRHRKAAWRAKGTRYAG